MVSWVMGVLGGRLMGRGDQVENARATPLRLWESRSLWLPHSQPLPQAFSHCWQGHQSAAFGSLGCAVSDQEH